MSEAELYDLLVDIGVSGVGTDAVAECQALVLDHLACGLFGMGLPWTRSVEQVALADAGGSRDRGARIYGSPGRVPARVAALVNGTAAHGFDLDDLHYPTMTHPGAVIVSAAFAVADEEQIDGRTFLSAVIAGYEAMARVSRGVGLRGGRLGFHGTAVQGPIGAAVAVCRLLGGGPREMANAVGIAASFGSGIKAFQHGPGAIKRLHAGRAAEGGVLAGRLGCDGFPGPDDALTGPFGFARVYGLGDHGTGDIDLGSADDPPAVRAIYLKPYAACGALHGLIRASEDLTGLDPARIRKIVLGAPRRVLEQNDIVVPTDVLTAQYSAQYAVAIGLQGRARDPRSFELEDAPGPDVAALIKKMTVEVDDRAEAAYPDANEGRVDVLLDGEPVRSAYGSMTSEDSQGWDAAVSKFGAVTEGLLTADVRDRVADGVAALAGGGTPAACLDAIGVVPAGGGGEAPRRGHRA